MGERKAYAVRWMGKMVRVWHMGKNKAWGCDRWGENDWGRQEWARDTWGEREKKHTQKQNKNRQMAKGLRVCCSRSFLSFFCFSLSIRLASLKNFRVEPEEEKVLIRMAHVLAELLREAILCRGKRRDPSGPQGALVHRQTKRRFEDSLVKRRNAKVRLYGENKLVTYGESGCE